MRKIFCILVCFLLLLVSFCSVCFADTYSFFSSVLPNSNQGVMLFDYYSSSENYDPLKHWVCWCGSQYNYYLAVENVVGSLSDSGSDITSASPVTVYWLHYDPGSYNVSSHYAITILQPNNFYLNYDNQFLLGNLDYSSEPEFSRTHSFQFMTIPLLFILVFAILFYVFRVRFDKDRSFSI